ncbi:hypothetical protein D3C78_1735020 [compost metagenome]
MPLKDSLLESSVIERLLDTSSRYASIKKFRSLSVLSFGHLSRYNGSSVGPVLNEQIRRLLMVASPISNGTHHDNAVFSETTASRCVHSVMLRVMTPVMSSVVCDSGSSTSR